MIRNVETVFSTTVVSSYEMSGIPREQIDGHVNEHLSHCLAEHIMKNIKELPVNYKMEIDPRMGDEIHTLKVNIISTEELLRLRDVENSYLYLLSKR